MSQVILASPNGTFYQLGVDNNGNLTTVAVSAAGASLTSTATYTPNDAITLVQNFVHGIPLANVQSQVCDIINSLIWTFYPWGWSIATLTAINCVDGQQDYPLAGADAAVILRPLSIRIVRTDVTPVEHRELEFLANLPIELTRKGGTETITACGYLPSSQTIRLLYPTGISGTQALQLQGFYQIKPTKITSLNMSSVFSFPDVYFPVFVEGVKWKMYQLSDDPRAGTAQYQKNGNTVRGYSGQLGVFMDALLQMARTEDLQQGDEFQFPQQPLGVGRSYWPGLYGL